MRAVVAGRPGPPDVLSIITLPDLAPGSGQGRVSVEFAAITFRDTMLRSGRADAPGSFPLVPGNGVGGNIDAVGPDVDPAWLDTKVVTSTGGTGGYASSALAHLDDLHRVPDDLELREATALLADGRTAIGLADAAAIRPGDRVVVSAAAGGVGSLLVQLAARHGASVIALAGSAAKLGLARELGAAHVVDYRASDWLERLDAVAPDGVDVVFDGVGGDLTAALARRTRTGGRYLQHGAAGGAWGELDGNALAARGVAVIPLAAIGSSRAELFELVERALELAARGDPRAVVGQVFPLDDASSAHAAIEARATIGKTLLVP
ncbi:zinc-binding dehydrogenase [Agromyces sp. Marseille-P2726]|uniref:zinc-binding dehydrogenase n=1 Tax=Agromyces sp. Marseille-P2726 TaxID=2709132 RepID=UPI001570749D|nr:zinc-binding dehydrogenase [Agromyces sp. Marseille-P2726]